MRRARVIITAAPGGHSGYAYAIGYYLNRLGVRPVFIIRRGSRWLRKKLETLGDVVEVTMPRDAGEHLVKTLHRWPRAIIEALRIVSREYDVAVSCGSNLSLAPSLAAKLKGLRLVNVESIVRLSSPGKTPAILDRFADVTLVHWEEQRRFFRRGLVVGPIYEPPRYKPRSEGYVLVTAGTVGHPRLFEAVAKLGLDKVVMQTGMVDPLRFRRSGWVVFRYTSDLGRWIAGADVVITHFPGMTSATAALGYGKPVVLVAAPHLRLSASIKDGPLYAEKIGAAYVEEPSPRSLAEAIKEAYRLAGRRPRLPNGAERAAKIILSLSRA